MLFKLLNEIFVQSLFERGFNNLIFFPVFALTICTKNMLIKSDKEYLLNKYQVHLYLSYTCRYYNVIIIT